MSEEINEIKEALLVLAKYVDGIAWRVTKGEEREGIKILEEIREMLDK